MKRLLLALPALFAILFFSGGAQATATPYVYQVYMYGDQVSPSVDTQIYGFLRFFFNQSFTEADVTVDVKGVSGSGITGADIRAGKPGSNGPVVFHLSDGDFIVTSAHIKVTPADLQHMIAGDWYGVVQTTYHADGEIRGQILLPAEAIGQAAPPATVVPPATGPCLADCGFVLPAPTATRAPAGGGGVVISPPNTGDAGLASAR